MNVDEALVRLVEAATLGAELVDEAREADLAMERLPDRWHERSARLREEMRPFVSPTAPPRWAEGP